MVPARLIAPSHAGNFPLMRRTFATIARYRPRALTLVVLFVVAALIALSNLSYEFREVTDGDPQARQWLRTVPYGWPLPWRRYVVVGSHGPSGAIAWHYSGIRLIGNLAMWLLMVAAPAGTCEWLLRRYRPRFRWSLRTMLVCVALLAALFGLIAAARNRADLHDSLIAAIQGRSGGQVWVERWGPKWLDLLGADRFRRHIFAVQLGTSGWSRDYQVDDEEERENIDLFKRLGQVHGLRYLWVADDRRTNAVADALADALGQMTHLRCLSIEDHNADDDYDDERFGRKCLAAIGDMTELEYLRLEGIIAADESMAELASLTNLKTLVADVCPGAEQPDSYPPLLDHLPSLPRLETLDLGGSYVVDNDLSQVAVLPSLKSLGIQGSYVTDAGLARLAPLTSLEELAIDDDVLSAAGLKSLLALKRLRTLHIRQWPYHESRLGPPAMLALDTGDVIFVPERQLDGCRLALDALRDANPEIVIDASGLARPADPAQSWRWDDRFRADSLWDSAFFKDGVMTWLAGGMATEGDEKLRALKW